VFADRNEDLPMTQFHYRALNLQHDAAGWDQLYYIPEESGLGATCIQTGTCFDIFTVVLLAV